MERDTEEQGVDRRTLIKRGAMLGGALVWTVPVVQSLSGPAFAQGSPASGPCSAVIGGAIDDQGTCIVYSSSNGDCCARLNTIKSMPTGDFDQIRDKQNALIALVLNSDCTSQFTAAPGPCTPPAT